MKHLRVRYVLLLITVLGIIAGGIIFSDDTRWMRQKEQNVFRRQAEEPVLTVSIGGNQYLSRAQNGTGIGEQIPPVTLMTSEGKEITLFTGDKKVLLAYGIPGCSTCIEFYPILQDWAERYKDELTVVLVYQREPQEAEVREQVRAGIEVILEKDQLAGILNPGSRFWSLLLDAEGVVQGRFSFDVSRWQEYDQLIERFAQGSIVQMNEVNLQLGQVLEIPAMVDFLGNTFRLAEYRGKPTLLLVLSPGCQTCGLSYQLLKRLHEIYADRLHQVVIMNYYSDEIEGKIHQYYAHFGVKRRAGQVDIKAPDELIRGQGLEHVALYFDQSDRVYNHIKAWITPTLLILDQEGVLVDIFGLGTTWGDAPDAVDFMIEQILMNLW